MIKATDTRSSIRLDIATFIYFNKPTYTEFLGNDDFKMSRNEKIWYLKMLELGPLTIHKDGSMTIVKKWAEKHLSERIKNFWVPVSRREEFEGIKMELAETLWSEPLSVEEVKQLDFMSNVSKEWFEQMYSEMFGDYMYLRDKKLTIKRLWAKKNLKNYDKR